MKARLLLMLFLIVIGEGTFASERPKKKTSAHCRTNRIEVMKRSIFEPSIQAEDVNDCLYLTFQFSLQDADITILDKDGNEVVKEQQTIIYEGRVIAISQSDGYPYSIEIISPMVSIQGEIVLK